MKLRSLLTVMALVFGTAACNVVQWQQAAHVGTLRDHGLHSRTFEVEDATMRCWVRAGEGTPVVLLHGFGAPALWQWSEQVGALSDRPLVLPDLLYFGRSTSHTGDHTLDHQVRSVVAVLAELGHDSVDLVGLSYGGLVATELATARPGLVRRLVIVDSPGRAYTRADHEAMLERFGVEHIGRVMVPAENDDVRRMMQLTYAHPPMTPDFALEQIRARFYPPSRRADLYAVLDALEDHLDTLRTRADPSAPTLLIWGRDDPVFPLELARRLQRRMGPETRLEIIEGARHIPNIEQPEAFNRVLIDFLSER